MSVTKAIIPAAGLGTRMYPVTKVIPKEMLPLMNKPIIQHIIEDAVESGIREFLVVINPGKEAIINHFRKVDFVHNELKRKGKECALEKLNQLISKINLEYVYQNELRGLGDAIRLGAEFADNQSIAVILGDNILESYDDIPVLKQLIEIYEEYDASCVSIQRVPKQDVSRYGVMKGKNIEKGIYKSNGWIEKPKEAEAPSDLVVAGQYIFKPQIFDLLKTAKPGKNGEIQITDAMDQLARESDMYGYLFNGKRHDMGNLESYTRTCNYFAQIQ